MLTLALALLPLLVQDSKPAPQQPKLVPEATKKEASDMLKQHKKLYKKKAPLAQRLKAVELLGKKRSPKFVSPLSKVLLGDKDSIVRAEAVKSLSQQRYPETARVLMQVLQLQEKKKDPVVTLAILDTMKAQKYDPRYFQVLAEIFPKDRTEARVQQRIIQIFGKGKEKRAFRLLVDNLDEPAPVSVDDPSNPPASYWEMRWKKWDVWYLDVKKALKDLTGVTFESAEFYKKWAKKEGKKHGLTY